MIGDFFNQIWRLFQVNLTFLSPNMTTGDIFFGMVVVLLSIKILKVLFMDDDK